MHKLAKCIKIKIFVNTKVAVYKFNSVKKFGSEPCEVFGRNSIKF